MNLNNRKMKNHPPSSSASKNLFYFLLYIFNGIGFSF